jgi:Flp pilus assembly CpaE family ATPase
MRNSYRTYRLNRQEESELAGSSASVNSSSSSNLDLQYDGSSETGLLSIALIGPDEERRNAVARSLAVCRAGQVREFTSYPPALDDVPRLLEQYYDVIIIDLDSDPEYAPKLVESICAETSATVMVYSAKADREMVFRCMRAGAREFLTPPFDQNTMAEALVRAAAILRPEARPAKRTRGKMLVFLGAKGGSGVTTIACNFAMALAQESGQGTLLIDLGLPLGDAALNLGIVSEFSTDNALQDADRLDANLLHKLLTKHRSGVSVLAAPSTVPEVQASNAAIDKLVAVARQDFDNVIVDVGSRLDLMGTSLFKEAFTVYLVTQAGISELRNSNRLISRFFNGISPKLEIVINRFEPSFLGVNEEHITKALTRPVQWKIPDDYDAVREMQNTATPLTLADSSISRLIRQMARSVCGLPATPDKEKKTGFLKGFGRSIAEKISTNEEMPTIASALPDITSVKTNITSVKPDITWPALEPITCGTPLGAAQLNATASVPGTFAYTPAAGYVLPVGTHTLWVTFTPAESAGGDVVQAAASITVAKATPAITWPEPSVLSCGTALSAAQLNATASVPGTFVYTPTAGEVLAVGTHTLSVIFTPKDEANYTSAQAAVPVTVAKATPTITWPAPAPISYGTPLGSAQLNATASVPGTFVYTPAEGEVLASGKHTLSAIFTPENTTDHGTAQAAVPLTVAKATPTITWPTPAPISYGVPLGATQLNATASVPGTFVYIPAMSAVLGAGTHTPSVVFTPENTKDYNAIQAAVSLTVVKVKPVIAWQEPAPITAGTPLGTAQLNATASVPGTFVYTHAVGEVLAAGKHTLAASFTPFDTSNYAPAQAAVSLTVTKTTPATIMWSDPAPIPYGTPLSATQLNATASVPGTFVYTPAAGDVLTAGRHTLSATFTPDDSAKYAVTEATVTLVVEGLQNIASLQTAAAQTPFTPANTTDDLDAAEAKRQALPSGSTTSRKGEPETRTYKGAIYEKGEDGQWHIQQK